MLEYIESQNYNSLVIFLVVRIYIVLVCWLFVACSSLIDFWSGVSTAKAVGEKLQSRGFRRTFTKIGDYIRVMLFAFMFDSLGSFMAFYVLPFATILSSIAVICIEGKSVIENSARKKANAAEVPEMVKQIVQAATAKQGLAIIEKLTKEK